MVPPLTKIDIHEKNWLWEEDSKFGFHYFDFAIVSIASKWKCPAVSWIWEILRALRFNRPFIFHKPGPSESHFKSPLRLVLNVCRPGQTEVHVLRGTWWSIRYVPFLWAALEFWFQIPWANLNGHSSGVFLPALVQLTWWSQKHSTKIIYHLVELLLRTPLDNISSMEIFPFLFLILEKRALDSWPKWPSDQAEIPNYWCCGDCSQ